LEKVVKTFGKICKNFWKNGGTFFEKTKKIVFEKSLIF
jgi:hypothetical protein